MFGSWIEHSFAIQIAALGLASAVIGIAELCGEGLVAAFVDRLGKRRALMLGLSAYIVACLLLPMLGTNFGIQGAMVGVQQRPQFVDDTLDVAGERGFGRGKAKRVELATQARELVDLALQKERRVCTGK